jgi:hypothetical protein
MYTNVGFTKGVQGLVCVNVGFTQGFEGLVLITIGFSKAVGYLFW